MTLRHMSDVRPLEPLSQNSCPKVNTDFYRYLFFSGASGIMAVAIRVMMGLVEINLGKRVEKIGA